jgi:Cys-rich protein (TIGR01571 family)
LPHFLSQPEGGVEAHETFRAVVLDKGPVVEKESMSTFRIPTGHWRDGMLDCFIYKAFRESNIILLYFCCPLIPLGQLMTRLNLNAIGKPASSQLRGYRCTRPFYVMIFVSVVSVCLFVNDHLLHDPSTKQPLWHALVAYTCLIFALIAHTRTRNLLRRKYKIGPNYGCLGDCCFAYWLGACSVFQMSSHTTDYRKRHKPRCCTETGLDDDVEPLVPYMTSSSSVQIV